MNVAAAAPTCQPAAARIPPAAAISALLSSRSPRSRREELDDVVDVGALDQLKERAEAALLDGAAARLAHRRPCDRRAARRLSMQQFKGGSRRR